MLAVAASSSAEESKLLTGGDDVSTLELRVADAVVGELRYRRRTGEPPATLTRMVSTLLALELERSRAPEWASDEAAGEFVDAGSSAGSPTVATSSPGRASSERRSRTAPG